MTPFTNADFEWLEDVRRQMKGFWVMSNGSLHVTFYTPSRWERFCAWFGGDHWMPYPSNHDSSNSAKSG